MQWGAENLDHTGIRSPGSPAPNEYLYRLHYSGSKGYSFAYFDLCLPSDGKEKKNS